MFWLVKRTISSERMFGGSLRNIKISQWAKRKDNSFRLSGYSEMEDFNISICDVQMTMMWDCAKQKENRTQL